MANEQINPSKITRPIQLLAAWLVGLISVNGSFLASAGLIKIPEWGSALLLIAAVINVPLFIGSLFLLLTVFRPEMQDDSYYSRYLEQKGKKIELKPAITVNGIEDKVREVIPDMKPQQEMILELLKKNEQLKLIDEFKDNRTLSELYLFKEKWNELVDVFEKDMAFRYDVERLIKNGIVTFNKDDIRKPQLTELGNNIAKKYEAEGKLWNQTHGRSIPRRN